MWYGLVFGWNKCSEKFINSWRRKKKNLRGRLHNNNHIANKQIATPRLLGARNDREIATPRLLGARNDREISHPDKSGIRNDIDSWLCLTLSQ